jgi:hypothetical protein
MSIKLTDTQLMMLSAAARRDDRYLVATPSLKVARRKRSLATDRHQLGKGDQGESGSARLAAR